MNAETVSRLLKAVAKAVEGMSDQEVDDFILRLREGRPSSPKRPAVPGPRSKVDAAQLSEISTRVGSTANRDEAFHVIRASNLTRTELVSIARANSVHVVKEDSVATIQSKIVEALVGARLNSSAIRGERS